jgi:hypothetical protein
VIIRQLDRVSVDAAVLSHRVRGAGGQDGGSDVAVMTAERVLGLEPLLLELSCQADEDGNQIVSVTGELDIATAERAYTYISDVIDAWPMPVSVDLSGLTFCDASVPAQDHADHRAGPGLPRAGPAGRCVLRVITTSLAR